MAPRAVLCTSCRRNYTAEGVCVPCRNGGARSAARHAERALGVVGVVGDFDRAVFQSLAAYCFHEAVCWPSQALIGRDLGVSQPTVSRSIARLRVAGWLEIIERRWSARTRKLHNVYELLEAWKPISRWVAEKIVKRAQDRRFWAVNSNRRFSIAKPGWRASRGAHSRPPDPPPRHPQADAGVNGIVGKRNQGVREEPRQSLRQGGWLSADLSTHVMNNATNVAALAALTRNGVA